MCKHELDHRTLSDIHTGLSEDFFFFFSDLEIYRYCPILPDHTSDSGFEYSTAELGIFRTNSHLSSINIECRVGKLTYLLSQLKFCLILCRERILCSELGSLQSIRSSQRLCIGTRCDTYCESGTTEKRFHVFHIEEKITTDIVAIFVFCQYLIDIFGRSQYIILLRLRVLQSGQQ